MSFKTYIPRESLRPYVKRIVISESTDAATYKVIPDIGMVMGFQYSGSLSFQDESESKPLSQAGITGLLDSYRVFSNTAHTGSVLVMFAETGPAAFFPQSMHELFGQSLSLEDLVLRSQMDVVTEQLHEATTETEKIRIVEEFLLSRLHTKQQDELVNLAVSLIRQYAGNIRMTWLADKLCISQGRLEKRFRKIVGASPKKFASIVRLRSVLDKKTKLSGLTQLGLDAGYFDQAHFIRDFKTFTGETPERFFGNT